MTIKFGRLRIQIVDDSIHRPASPKLIQKVRVFKKPAFAFQGVFINDVTLHGEVVKFAFRCDKSRRESENMQILMTS